MPDKKPAVPTIGQLRARSDQLFTDLLTAEYPTGRRAAAGRATRSSNSARTGRPRSFSWFDPDDAAAATALAAELAIVAATGASPEAGLSAALDLARARTGDDPPGLVRQAMAMFVTHHKPARRLGKPRSVVVRPEAFVPSKVGTTAKPARRAKKVGKVGTGTKARTLGSSPEAQLDYWREDALANEHHEHWHEVYPFSGLLPSDWNEWAAAADQRRLAALLQTLEPRPGNQWLDFVRTRPAPEVAQAFVQRASQVDFGLFLRQLTPEAYRTLFRLNDRQGELFVYMHCQMLARYDAERLSVGLARVASFGPPFTSTPPDGYDPAPLPGYLPRPQGRRLANDSATRLVQLQQEIVTATAAKRLDGPTAAGVPIDRTIIGEAIEAAEARLRAPLRAGKYTGLHNIGHGRIAAVSAVAGDGRGAVMNDPAAAIRDPIFWRWHKNIDDLGFAWQQTQPAYRFDDLPAVQIRDVLPGAAGPLLPWTSPDLYLVARTNAKESATAASRIRTALTGANADKSVADGPVRNLSGYRFTSELGTLFRSRLIAGVTTKYLTHQPFGYAVRLTNPGTKTVNLTVRTFIVPAQLADDRRAWIELDKVAHAVSRRSTSVLYRSDTEMSVIKRPAETDPAAVQPSGTDPEDESYCVCGWPWTLLLPRGRPDGMQFRMVVLCTDGAVDQVPQPTHCGSMSYCGAVDRYPDTRDMGYPFSRPFTGTITDTFLSLGAAAGRSFAIRHLGQQ